jgi:hypothetical protein
MPTRIASLSLGALLAAAVFLAAAAGALAAPTQALTIDIVGSGSVQCKLGAGPAEACAAEYEEGKGVIVIASPAVHNHFTGWGAGCDSHSGAESTECHVLIGSTPRSVEAKFALNLPTISLWVNTPESPDKATLRAFLIPRATTLTECKFEYGPTTAYGQSAPCLKENGNPIGTFSESKQVTIIAHLGGLQQGATYHYRLLAANATGPETTPDGEFVATAAESSSCPNDALRVEQHSTALPDCRAYELVSPPDKQGLNIIASTSNTRAASEGTAAAFGALGAFGDARGTAVAVEYLARRSLDPDPGNNGWSTHAITPAMPSLTLFAIKGSEPRYVREFSPDLNRGAFLSFSPLTDDPWTSEALNLYRRSDLLSPGAGTWDLLSSCPLCAATETPLSPPESDVEVQTLAPRLASSSPDLERIAFQSRYGLTADAPTSKQFPLAYEWVEGVLRLAGRVPAEPASEASCDDISGPACQASPISFAGQGTGNFGEQEDHRPAMTPDVVSDGSDGHTRAFFTVPTNKAGTEIAPESYEGRLYMRLDGHATVQLDVPETPAPTEFAAAHFDDASADGTRAFFSTTQALTEEAVQGSENIYMYDANAEADHHLTLVNKGVTSGSAAISGISRDGHYVYFFMSSDHFPSVGGSSSAQLYLWHDGEIVFVGSVPGLNEELTNSPLQSQSYPSQVRVSPDGRHLLFGAFGSLLSVAGGSSKRRLYIYSADTNTLQCASCTPSAAGGFAATTYSQSVVGGLRPSIEHVSNALATDGRYSFFTTQEALLPEDTNGVSDAYVFDAASDRVHLLSSGTSPDHSYFLDASSDGSDVFIDTAQRLSGWDVDGNYDLYDARVDGGFPEPALVPAPCVGESCRPGASVPPPLAPAASAAVFSPGNPKSCARKRGTGGGGRCGGKKGHRRRHPSKPAHPKAGGAK